MVFAAGFGTRMRPRSLHLPKPLIEVAGKPLIDYTLDMLADAGVEQAVVNVHYLADLLEAHLNQRHRPTILISDERHKILETGGGLVKALPLLGKTAFFCCNTDAILQGVKQENPLVRLITHFDPDKMDALLLLCPREHSTGYAGKGDFCLDDEGAGAIRWPDPDMPSQDPLIYTGYQIIHPRLIQTSPATSDEAFSLKLFWQNAITQGRAYGLRHRGSWMHVGDEQGLAEAQQRLWGKETRNG